MAKLFCSLLIFIQCVCSYSQDVTSITVSSVSPMIYSLRGPLPGEFYAASAEFSDSTNHKSNFGQLTVRSSSNFSDDKQLFAAGFSEGYLTAVRIFQQYNNMLCEIDCTGNRPKEVEDFFIIQDAWVRTQVEKNPTSTYWNYLGSLMEQFDGQRAGYAASDFGQAHPLDRWAFMLLNGIGDLFDVIPAVVPNRKPDFHAMTYVEAKSYLTRAGHCSALVRVTDDLSDILVGHNSWYVYSAMLRIFKTYRFDLHNRQQRSSAISFSSYPGMLSSLDDFYMMADSNLIMVQTTNNVFNASLWDLIVPQSLLGA